MSDQQLRAVACGHCGNRLGDLIADLLIQDHGGRVSVQRITDTLGILCEDCLRLNKFRAERRFVVATTVDAVVEAATAAALEQVETALSGPDLDASIEQLLAGLAAR